MHDVDVRPEQTLLGVAFNMSLRRLLHRADMHRDRQAEPPRGVNSVL